MAFINGGIDNNKIMMITRIKYIKKNGRRIDATRVARRGTDTKLLGSRIPKYCRAVVAFCGNFYCFYCQRSWSAIAFDTYSRAFGYVWFQLYNEKAS
jgi:hypothetical protein